MQDNTHYVFRGPTLVPGSNARFYGNTGGTAQGKTQIQPGRRWRDDRTEEVRGGTRRLEGTRAAFALRLVQA